MTKIYYLNYEDWSQLEYDTPTSLGTEEDRNIDGDENFKNAIINHPMVEVYTSETLCEALNEEDVSDMGYFLCVQENEANEELESLRKEFEQYKKESIKWDVDDFKQRAIDFTDEESWTEYYDESEFQEALENMISHHDAEHGISWTDIDYYLDEYCKKVIDDTSFDKDLLSLADDTYEKHRDDGTTLRYRDDGGTD